MHHTIPNYKQNWKEKGMVRECKWRYLVWEYINKNYYGYLEMYTDGSKD